MSNSDYFYIINVHEYKKTQKPKAEKIKAKD